MRSSGCGSIAATSLATTPRSTRKFWPKRRRALCNGKSRAVVELSAARRTPTGPLALLLFEVILDVGLVALLPHPVVPLLVRLARPDRLARASAAGGPVDMSCSRRSRTCTMCQPNGLRNGALTCLGLSASMAFSKSGTVSPGDSQPRSPPRAAEASSECRRASSAKSPPLSTRYFSSVEAVAGIRLGDDFVQAHQDMARVRLRDDNRGVAAAQVLQLEDVEAGGAAQNLRDLTDLHRAQGVEEDGSAGGRPGASPSRRPAARPGRRKSSPPPGGNPYRT